MHPAEILGELSVGFIILRDRRAKVEAGPAGAFRASPASNG